MSHRLPVCLLLMGLSGCDSKKPAPKPASHDTPPGQTPPSTPDTPPLADRKRAPSESVDRPMAARPMSEAEKIEALIGIIEKLDGAVFIRNGKEHDCREAAKHLRDKWAWKRKKIRTCRDFIRIAASGSSVSGKPYWIRFKDGRQVRNGEFLSAELAKLEGSNGNTANPHEE